MYSGYGCSRTLLHDIAVVLVIPHGDEHRTAVWGWGMGRLMPTGGETVEGADKQWGLRNHAFERG